MRKETLYSIILVLAGACAAFAQDAAIKPVMLSGDVVSIAPDKIVVKTKDGEANAVLTDKTQFVRVPPENTSQKLPSSIEEIVAGDRVVVSALPNADKLVLSARTVFLMSKSEIALRQQKSDQDWKTRGTVGKVDNYSPVTRTITITTRVMGADKKITVKPKDAAEFWRYAPDSIDFAKAKQSAIGEILPGDEIRVLGSKNADGTEIDAEKVVTGAFQTKAGTIKSINIEKNEVVITDSANKKDIVVKLGEASILKQFPAELATRLAQFQMMSAMGGMGGGGMMRPPGQGGGGQGGQMNPPANPQPNPTAGNGQPQGSPTGGMGGFRAGGGGGAIDDSRFPSVKIMDLKVGEIVGVLSTRTSDTASVRAIKLFTGVEPFVKAAQTAATSGRGGQGGGQGGGGASLSIPGLDGFGGN